MLKYHVVDAFAEAAFEGNQAGVIVLEGERNATWLQEVAAEFNLSETAFLIKQGENAYALRWFTPGTEVPLCGHATLASAHVLWQTGQAKADDLLTFDTLSGKLSCKNTALGIEMDFPALSCTPSGFDKSVIEQAIGAPVAELHDTREDVLAILENETLVRGLQPDMGRIAALPYRGVLVSAKGDDAFAGGVPVYDFVSRFFVPKIGIPEDPVTGSAHCVLTPFWAGSLGKTEFRAYQASKRGGVVHTRLEGGRVVLRGTAITVMAGELYA